MKRKKVCLIVVNHNGLKFLPQCFDSVMKLKYDNLSIVMVDNASTDGSQEFIRRNYPEVFLIQNPRNDGFSAGMNLGIQHALSCGAQYIASLNNDTEVDPGWISEMVRVAESNSKIGAVASRMMFMDNRRIINGIGVSMNFLALCWDRYQGRVFSHEMDHSEEVFSVCGGACLFRSEALLRAGLFDPLYIMYLEDVDLCIRIKERGYRIVTAPRAIIYHKFSASIEEGSARKNYMALRSRLCLILKFFPLGILLQILLRVYYHEIRELQNFLLERNFNKAYAQIRALFSPLTFLGAIFSFRISTLGRFGYRAIKGIRWASDVDCLPPFRGDFRRPEKGEKLPVRILMGVNDTVLGDGWYHLEGSSPFYRWTADRAECFLMAQKGKPHTLQLHLRQPFLSRKTCQIIIWENSQKLATLDLPTGEWQTLHVRLAPSKDHVRIIMEVKDLLKPEETGDRRDLGFQCNEVSLIPEDSPFLRK